MIFDLVIDEESHENILIYDISYKTLVDSEPLCIRFDKIDGFIRIYDRIRCLTLFDSGVMKTVMLFTTESDIL